jgi:uncharacterized protein YbjT (DUF2867 family)
VLNAAHTIRQLGTHTPPPVMSLRILVTGATGKQGGACVNALLASSNTHDIYAVTRTSKSPAAEKLAKRGVHVIEGNLDDPDSIFAKIDGVLDGVFLVQPSAGGGQTGNPI